MIPEGVYIDGKKGKDKILFCTTIGKITSPIVGRSGETIRMPRNDLGSQDQALLRHKNLSHRFVGVQLLLPADSVETGTSSSLHLKDGLLVQNDGNFVPLGCARRPNVKVLICSSYNRHCHSAYSSLLPLTQTSTPSFLLETSRATESWVFQHSCRISGLSQIGISKI